MSKALLSICIQTILIADTDTTQIEMMIDVMTCYSIFDSLCSFLLISYSDVSTDVALNLPFIHSFLRLFLYHFLFLFFSLPFSRCGYVRVEGVERLGGRVDAPRKHHRYVSQCTTLRCACVYAHILVCMWVLTVRVSMGV